MRRLLVLVLVVLPMVAMAQIQFGYLSYDAILKEMPAYAKVLQDMDALKAKYDAEALRGEEEFQKKFVDFLHGQKDFPPTIMQKRQAELQTLMDNGVEFRLKVQTLLAQAKEEMLAEVQKQLNRAILEVGVEYGYGYILNTDGNSCPYINPVAGVDVTILVKRKLGLIEDVAPTQPVEPVVPTPPVETIAPVPVEQQPEVDVTTH